MQEHDRFDYSPIVQRPPRKLPNDARVGVWVIPNIEHFLFDRPSTSLTGITTSLVPDILNYSWRDYGPRVGVWRMMEVLAKHGVKVTAALNSDVCARYPELIKAGCEHGWEWMGHGKNNSSLFSKLPEDQERALIREVLDTIHDATGVRPRGWLSPALSETHNTPDLLAEAGIEYTANWVNDEQPYQMKVKTGSLVSLPYAIELNDIPAFLDLKQSGEQFATMIRDTFDVLYEEGASQPRFMAISLHPFLVGHPHRSKPFERALEYIKQRGNVWFATGSEILDWHNSTRG
jgi:peptidoglycan/xylan/chitin deacetylase (PgdA/CDA1 family)